MQFPLLMKVLFNYDIKSVTVMQLLHMMLKWVDKPFGNGKSVVCE